MKDIHLPNSLGLEKKTVADNVMPETNIQPPPDQLPYIFCIEDERPILGLVCEALEAAGYRLTYAADSEQALSKMARHQPDVLLVDLTRRDAEGWKAYRAVKENNRLKHITVIDVSARSTQLLGRARIHDFPAVDDYAHQPSDIERLIHAVQVLARK